MKRLLLLAIGLWMVLPISHAQTRMDSLKQKLHTTVEPLKKARLLSTINKMFFFSAQYDSLSRYADDLKRVGEQVGGDAFKQLADVYKAQSFLRRDSSEYLRKSKEVLEACRKNNFIPGIAITCLGMGSRLLTFGKYKEASIYLWEGHNVIQENDNEWAGLKSDLIRTVSAVAHHQGNYTDALDYGLQSSKLAERSGESIQILKSYLNLSGLYGELSSPENGLGTAVDRKRYHAEAKKYMMLSYKFSIINGSRFTQGATAFNLGSLYAEDKTTDSARHYLDEAIRIGIQTGFQELLSNAYRMKSTLYASQPDSSIYFLDLAYVHAGQAKNPLTKIATQLDKARVWTKQRRWEASEKLAVSILIEAKQLKLLNDQRAALLLLYEIKSATGNPEDALSYYKQYTVIKDSIVSEKNLARIEELKTKYESDLKDSEISNLEQQNKLQEFQIRQKNYLIIAVIAGAFLVAAFFFLYFRHRSLAQQQKALAIENRFLRFQLDPHFISNALVSIQRFIIDHNPSEASNYLTKFSKLMRQLLEHSREEFITIKEEVDLLNNYLALQKLRLKSKFDYEIHVDKELMDSDLKVSPMFAQPFVENAVEHGLSNISQGRIDVSFTRIADMLRLTIEDNGPGISDTGPGKRSVSTTIIRERIELLNKSSAKPIELKIDKIPGNGVSVQLLLPIYS